MRYLFQIVIMTSILTGYSFSAHAQKSPQRTAAARAAYGNTAPAFKANRKKNQKVKKKARKSARRKNTNNNASYWKGRPF